MHRNNYRGNRRFGSNRFKRGRNNSNRGNNFSNRSKESHNDASGYRDNYKSKSFRPTNRIEHEQLTEIEVGITEYISPYEGFSGVLKARYSDFHVNEINLDGQIAKLTNTDIPPEFAETLAPTDYKNISNPSKHIPDDIWLQIVDIVETKSDNHCLLNVTKLNKGDRTEIHSSIKGVFKQKIAASTVAKGEEKFIEFKRHNNKDNRMNWPTNVGEYVHFIVHKQATDTLQATYLISDCLKMRSNLFAYAGVKDSRAKTSQWYSVRKVYPKKLLGATKKLKNIHIGNISLKNEPLKLGHLKGNQFRIALRNVTGSDELIGDAVESLKTNGFINYYGLQRFGCSKEVPTYEIGLELMLENWEKAVDLILKPKNGEDHSSDIYEAKNVYFTTKDALKAANCFRKNRNKCVESKLLDGLAKHHKNDFVNALEKVPRNMRLLYIHSFQSLIWNKIVSRRIKEFGLKPIIGDLVLETKDDDEVIAVEECNSEELDAETELEENPSKGQKVKVLTEKDLDKFNIYDIVLPQPGYDIVYPENIVKTWYKELLESYGLKLEMPKQKVKTYNLSGAYRKIIAKVDNFSWKIMRYNDPTQDLIRSDYDEFHGVAEPQDISDGKYKSLILDFCLASSSYATMALREILKIDTSTAAQSRLNNYHFEDQKQDIDSEKSEKTEVKINANSGKSDKNNGEGVENECGVDFVETKNDKSIDGNQEANSTTQEDNLVDKVNTDVNNDNILKRKLENVEEDVNVKKIKE